MRSVNKVILIGNLTRDPELKSTTSGQSIVTFGIATNRQWTTSGGEKRSSAEFHECVAWAKLAEICQQYLKKGMLVYVEGYLKTRSWDMEDGTRRFRTEVVLHDMIILEKRRDGDEPEYVPAGDDVALEEGPSMGDDAGKGDDDDDDDDAKEEKEDKKEEAPAEEPAAEEAPAEEEKAGEIKADIDDDDMF